MYIIISVRLYHSIHNVNFTYLCIIVNCKYYIKQYYKTVLLNSTIMKRNQTKI